MPDFQIMTGNEACVRGALAAGMRFFAGYPITPATEIAELSSVLLPRHGGRYIQMEDELASIAAIIGASLTGAKAMTATSGPGFSLMQENLGFGIMAEIPCVVVNVMRQGPCQGVPTAASQGDLMQARWGTHGDHPAIVLAPASVQEVYTETIRAFNLAERFRTPVILLSDAILAHMSERVRIPAPGELRIDSRKRPACAPAHYQPYQEDEDGVPPMAAFGDGYRWSTSGIVHTPGGFPQANNPARTSSQIDRLHTKITRCPEAYEKYETYLTDDADVILVGVGLVARCAKMAVDELRKKGIKAGLFRPITLWPLPEAALIEAAGGKQIVCCEMNRGQLVHALRSIDGLNAEVHSLAQNDGALIQGDTIVKKVEELFNHE